MSEEHQPARVFGFCFRVFTYPEMPDGSVVFLNVCVCAECLETDAAEAFRLLLEEERRAYLRRTSIAAGARE